LHLQNYFCEFSDFQRNWHYLSIEKTLESQYILRPRVY
jgi:hypothetical protein